MASEPSSVLKTFITELNTLGLELQARRDFCDDAVAFLTEYGLVRDFESYRKARRDAEANARAAAAGLPAI